jgi:hypothetical protein
MSVISATFFGVAGLVLLVAAAVQRHMAFVVVGCVSLALAAWDTTRVVWTSRHPEVTRQVTMYASSVARARPARTLAVSTAMGAAFGVCVVWNTPFFSQSAPWIWIVSLSVGGAVGYALGRARLRRARGTQPGP